MPNDAQQNWESYRAQELAEVTPLLATLGFTLDEHQPHIGGERHLMHAVTTASGRKLILLGKRVSDGKRMVIKATSDPAGMRELSHERTCRTALKEIAFAYQVFFSPEEILFTKQNGYLVSIQAFIEQERTFLERPLEEQFFVVLRAFKAQESAHATTYGHRRLIQKTFGQIDAEGYIRAYRTFRLNIEKNLPKRTDIHALLRRGTQTLERERATIEQYGGFLTHTDFVPHNFRIADGTIYLLDHSSLRFGNKYEGWARFLNFMTLYNRPLEDALLFYVKNNRTPEEYRALELMRIYRLGEIVWFYTNILEKTSGDLRELTEARIAFWAEVLKATLDRNQVSKSIIQNYKNTRDALRSKEEKERQKGLH